MGKIALTFFSREALLIERNRGFMSERPKQWGHSLSSNKSWGETGASGQCQFRRRRAIYRGGRHTFRSHKSCHCRARVRFAVPLLYERICCAYYLFFFLRGDACKGTNWFSVSTYGAACIWETEAPGFFVGLEKRKGTPPGYV